MSDTPNSPGPFDRAFAITVVGHEGLTWDTTYADPGNWTGGAVGQGKLNGSFGGISAAAYPKLDIEHLTEDAIKAIYRPDYWDKIRGDDLPVEIAILVFDAAVNNGISRAARWLQAAAEVDEDGVIGPATVAAVLPRAIGPLAVEFQAQRFSFMASLPTWRIFGLGWARRLCALPYEAMAAAT